MTKKKLITLRKYALCNEIQLLIYFPLMAIFQLSELRKNHFMAQNVITEHLLKNVIIVTALQSGI